jgi:hypothetical protein
MPKPAPAAVPTRRPRSTKNRHGRGEIVRLPCLLVLEDCVVNPHKIVRITRESGDEGCRIYVGPGALHWFRTKTTLADLSELLHAVSLTS